MFSFRMPTRGFKRFSDALRQLAADDQPEAFRKQLMALRMTAVMLPRVHSWYAEAMKRRTDDS
jgi:hypothetical protein